MDFEAVFRLLIENFQSEEIDFAIIGGFALHAAGYTRTTKDIDFLVAKEDMPGAKKIRTSGDVPWSDTLSGRNLLYVNRK